ncbi:hypothetical protein OAK19_06365 [Aureispira]|nr:hypothetical protein [Aureispira sp.]
MQVAGDYRAAEHHYISLLKIFPNSAGLNYESYYSKSLLLSNGDPERIIQLWKDCKTAVYACDPLFNMNVPSSNSKDAYLMSKRHQINILFDNQPSIQKNILEYADIALDLEVYGFAAHMYWLILKNKPKSFSKRDILAHYLYCLEKLGDTENILKYEKEYSRQKFRKIEKERIKIMESSEVYNRSSGTNSKTIKGKQKKKRK